LDTTDLFFQNINTVKVCTTEEQIDEKIDSEKREERERERKRERERVIVLSTLFSRREFFFFE